MADRQPGAPHHFWRIFGPAIVLTIVALVVTYLFVDPAPPKQITIATGRQDGAYHGFGLRYREILAREGVELVVRATAGSVENIELLEDPDSGVDVAFVQGGTSGFAETDTLVSLASLYYEPLWAFHRAGVTMRRPSDAIGKRVSLGPDGSGTRAVAQQILADSRLTGAEFQVSDINGIAAIEALDAGDLDLVLSIASAESDVVRRVLDLDGVVVGSLDRPEAYARRHKFLNTLSLPAGVLDLRDNKPPEEIILVGPAATLVAGDLHPALVDLLLEAADEVHRPGGLFEAVGEFPSPNHVDFPLSKEARRFFESGPPFLRRTLPFWAATMLDRLKIMLVPLIVLIFPLLRIMPNLYRWRMRSRVYRWYKELRTLDAGIRKDMPDDVRSTIVASLERIERDVRVVSIPWSYAEQLYQLRLHIQYVRGRLP